MDVQNCWLSQFLTGYCEISISKKPTFDGPYLNVKMINSKIEFNRILECIFKLYIKR